MARALPDCGAIAAVEPLLKGHGHESFVVHSAARGDVLLKIALRPEQLAKMQSLRRVLEIAAQHDIPAPRLLYFCESSEAFGGRPWLIQEFFEGADGETAMAEMNDAQRRTFFRDFGRAVERLHAVDIGYFAEEFASGRREDTWAALVDARLAELEARHRRTVVAPPERVEAASHAIRSAARSVTVRVPPSLVHRDLYLPNTLVTGGRFRCLLDFEHARSSDAIADFVKLRMWVFEELGDGEPDFLAGYGSNPLATPGAAVRYRVALGLELLSGLVYFSATGQPAMVVDYQRRFDEWLAGSARVE